MSLIGCVDRELKGEVVDEMHVREHALLAVLADLFAFHRVVDAVLIQEVCDGFGCIREDVEIDIGSLPYVARQHAANQTWPKWSEAPHHRKRRQAHGKQI